MFTRNYRWLDVRDLIPNKDNFFDINEDEILSLIDLILTTGNTDPILVREKEQEGSVVVEIVDGERRTIAHKRMGEEIDPKWFMIPARYYGLGELSDSEVKVILAAENLGQRNMSESNRAQAFAAVADALTEERKRRNPDAKEAWIKDELAKQFGVSPRTAQMNMNIGRHLVDRGLRLLDEKRITKAAADAISTLTAEQQEDILDQIEEGSLKKSDAEAAARDISEKRKSAPKRAPRSFEGTLDSAIKSLRRAVRMGGIATRTDVASIRDLVDRIDPDLQAR